MEFKEKLKSRIESGRVRVENESGLEVLNALYVSHKQAKRYGKLFSKSPELLEMVKKLHNLLEEHQPNWYLLGHHKEIENLIKEATTI